LQRLQHHVEKVQARETALLESEDRYRTIVETAMKAYGKSMRD